MRKATGKHGKDNVYRREVVNCAERNAAIADFLHDVIRDDERWPGIVFVRHRRHAKLLARELEQRLGVDVPAVTSAEMAQKRRVELSERVRALDPSLPVVVATEVWSTGIDIPGLRWVFVAGEGRAPVGLKQRGGRPTRLFEEKDDYTIYDLSTVGGDQRFEKQAEERLEHCRKAGFAIGDLTVNSDSEDAKLLAELLQLPPPGPEPEPPLPPTPADLEVERMLRPWDAKDAIWALVLLTLLMLLWLAKNTCA